MKLILALAIAVSARAQAPPDTIYLAAAPPAPVQGVNTRTVGNPGPATYFYWVIANYAGGSAAPQFPATAINAPSPLSGSNYVAIGWTSSPGATTYDILRTPTPVLPSSCAACAVSTGVSGTSVNDQGGALTSYSLSLKPGALGQIHLDNSQSSPQFLFSPAISAGGSGSVNCTAVNGTGALAINFATAGPAGTACTDIQVTLTGNVTSVTLTNGSPRLSITWVQGGSAFTVAGLAGNLLQFCPVPAIANSTVTQNIRYDSTNYNGNGCASSLTNLVAYCQTGAALGTPASGTLAAWCDSTDNDIEVKDASGNVYKMTKSGVDVNPVTGQVVGLSGVPFCSGFSPSNGQNLKYTTGGTPNPCWSAGSGSTTNVTPGWFPYAALWGASSITTAANTMYMFLLDSPAARTAAKCGVTTGSNSQHFACAIYDLSGNLITAGTGAATGGGSQSWAPLAFTFAAGSSYYLALSTDGINSFSAIAGASLVDLNNFGTGTITPTLCGTAANPVSWSGGAATFNNLSGAITHGTFCWPWVAFIY